MSVEKGEAGVERVEATEAARDTLQRTHRVLRRLVKKQNAGEMSGEDYEKLITKATRVTKQSAALLEEASARDQSNDD